MGAAGDLASDRRDGRRHVRFEQPERTVRLCGGLLHECQGAQEPARHRLAGDREIQDGPLGGGAVQRVGWYLHLAHRIALEAGGRCRRLGHGAIVGPGREHD